MKPESMRRFDMFFLASVALLAIGFFVSFDATVAAMQAQTAAQGLEVGSGFVIGIFGVVVAIYLLLWFFVSRKGAAVAKWLLVVLLLIDLYGLRTLIGGDFSAPQMISLLRIALEAVAIAFLFRADAKAWLAGSHADDAGPAA